MTLSDDPKAYFGTFARSDKVEREMMNMIIKIPNWKQTHKIINHILSSPTTNLLLVTFRETAIRITVDESLSKHLQQCLKLSWIVTRRLDVGEETPQGVRQELIGVAVKGHQFL